MSVVYGQKIKYILALAAVSLAAVALVAALSFGRTPVAFADGYADENADGAGYCTVKIVADGRTFVYEDKPIIPSDFTVAEEIERRKINAPIEQKREYMDACLSKGADHRTAVLCCFPLIERTVRAATDSVFVPPVQASVLFDRAANAFTFTHERAGRAADEARLYADIYYCLRFSGSGTVTAAVKTVPPDVTESMLRANFTLRSSYTTDFRASTPSRSHNVALALSKLSGTVIPAGQTLSFNAAVGARTEQNGFKSAKIIVDGKYVDGVGGGVCQASTALYNAALTAGLKCAANAHSICPSYCPAGLDAMISGASDLKITNPTDFPVYVIAYASGGMGTVRIFGEPTDVTVEPQSVVVKTVPFSVREVIDYEHKYFEQGAPSGQKVSVCLGKEGIRSETYLVYKVHGAVVERVKIRENEYISVEQVIAVSP